MNKYNFFCLRIKFVHFTLYYRRFLLKNDNVKIKNAPFKSAFYAVL